MRVLGIIAEYNPFHRGHAYHIQKSRQMTGADYVVAVMSGNFVQRGAPAMFDKYTRAEAALRNGVDLVLELPLSCAAGSAEFFSACSVNIFHSMNIITDLCFGSESGELAPLMEAANILAEEPEEYKKILKEQLKYGRTFPEARAAALQAFCSIPAEDLKAPNTLLGLEYLKALRRVKSSIKPWTIRRVGQNYHEGQMTNNLPSFPSSASAIRTALIKSHGRLTDDIKAQLPSAELYSSYDGKEPVTEDAFSLLLLEKLRRLEGQPLDCYFDVSPDLSHRIQNCLDSFQSFRQFTELVKTRNLTYTAVSRALLHILLDIREPENPGNAYHILGFRREAKPLLKMLESQGTLPLLTSPKSPLLPKEALYADHLYESVRALLHGTQFQNEYRRKFIVIS